MRHRAGLKDDGEFALLPMSPAVFRQGIWPRERGGATDEEGGESKDGESGETHIGRGMVVSALRVQVRLPMSQRFRFWVGQGCGVGIE